jgi:hypothetical protein
MVLPVERWHARARLAREAAQQIADEERRSLMLLYAAECERIADQCLLGFAPAEETGDADPPLATASLPQGGDIPGDPGELPFASTDERLLGIYRYWCERRLGRKFPGRQDMDPLDFAFALGRISIIEVQLAPRNFRYRLVSTQLTEHLGYEMSGKTVDAIPDAAMREFARSFYERVLERAAPTYETQSVVIGGFGWWHETLALPLATDGETIDMLLIYRNTERPVAISSAA